MDNAGGAGRPPLGRLRRLVNDEKFDKDPNLATEAPPDRILTGALVGSILLQDGHLARLSGVWTHQFTGSDRQFLAYNEYRVSADDFTNMWNLATRILSARHGWSGQQRQRQAIVG